MYDNVYYVAVAVENFNTGYSSYKIYFSPRRTINNATTKKS